MSGFGKLGVATEQAFAKCEICGAIPHGTGRLCRGCRRRNAFKAAAVVFVLAEGVFAAGLFLLPGSDASKTPEPSATHAAALPFAIAAASGWTAFDTHDAVLGTITHHATLASATPREDAKDPDLHGITAGTLELTNSVTEGKSVTLSFAKVKSDCQSSHCRVRASFDETQPEAFACDDKSAATTVLQLADYDRFTQRLAVSHDLTLVAELGTRHPTVLRFTVAGYETAANGARLIIRLAALPSPAARPYPG